MKQPNFKDYETLQEYAKAFALYEVRKQEEKEYKQEEERIQRISQASIDFTKLYPNPLELLRNSGIDWKFGSNLNGISVFLELYLPGQTQSFTCFEMYFDDRYSDSRLEMWAIKGNNKVVSEKKLINIIIGRSGILQEARVKNNSI